MRASSLEHNPNKTQYGHHNPSITGTNSTNRSHRSLKGNKGRNALRRIESFSQSQQDSYHQSQRKHIQSQARGCRRNGTTSDNNATPTTLSTARGDSTTKTTHHVPKCEIHPEIFRRNQVQQRVSNRRCIAILWNVDRWVWSECWKLLNRHTEHCRWLNCMHIHKSMADTNSSLWIIRETLQDYKGKIQNGMRGTATYG